MHEFSPDFIIIASEDPGQLLLLAALKFSAPRVVYLARTTLALPFGPASPFQSPAKTSLLHQTAGTVAVSRYLCSYIRRWGDLDCVELPLCPNGPGPFPRYGSFDTGYITLINPCAYKGLPIFTELTKTLPERLFAAVPTWGTTRSDIRRLQELPNVRLLDPADDVDQILAVTRVLLVPSLWAEAKANVITEAMLRGIPVLASDVGGNAEAMMGLDYLLPVNAITEFDNGIDERLLPTAVVPKQDVTPWEQALRELLSSRERYDLASTRARSGSLAMNKTQTVVPFEQYLLRLHSARNHVNAE